jgi:hypothetical protein
MIVSYLNTKTGDVQSATAVALAVYPLGIALLELGYELIHIGRHKDDHCEISIADIHSAKRNRDRFLREGVPCAALPDIGN